MNTAKGNSQVIKPYARLGLMLSCSKVLATQIRLNDKK